MAMCIVGRSMSGFRGTCMASMCWDLTRKVTKARGGTIANKGRARYRTVEMASDTSDR